MYEPAPVHILIDQKFANRSESYSVSFFLIFRCRRKKRRKRPSYLFPSLVQNHKMMALRCLLGRTPKPSLGFRGGGGGVKARNYTLIRTGDSLRKWDFPDPQLPINEDFPGVNHVIIKPEDAPLGMDPELFRRSFTGGFASAGLVTDSKVVEPACSAVQQYNAQQNAKLEFVRVLRAYKQVGFGITFVIILEAIDGGVKKKCRAEILRDFWSNYALQSFEVVPELTSQVGQSSNVKLA